MSVLELLLDNKLLISSLYTCNLFVLKSWFSLIIWCFTFLTLLGNLWENPGFHGILMQRWLLSSIIVVLVRNLDWAIYLSLLHIWTLSLTHCKWTLSSKTLSWTFAHFHLWVVFESPILKTWTPPPTALNHTLQ